MSNRFLYRIITFVAHPPLLPSPKAILTGGNRVIILGDKQRYFTVRKVFYDDDMTPMYALTDRNEIRCSSLVELKEKYPIHKPIWDSPILDNDNSLKVYETNN